MPESPGEQVKPAPVGPPPLDYEPREEPDPEPWLRRHLSGESLANVLSAAFAVVVISVWAFTGVQPLIVAAALLLAVGVTLSAPAAYAAVAGEVRYLFAGRAERLGVLRSIAFFPDRYCEWQAELDGEPVALLTRPRWEEMFWCSYRVHALTRDPALREKLLTHAFWWHGVDLAFRHHRTGWVNEFTFPGGRAYRDEKGFFRIVMRSLHPGAPRRPLQARLALRRWRRKRDRAGMKQPRRGLR